MGECRHRLLEDIGHRGRVEDIVDPARSDLFHALEQGLRSRVDHVRRPKRKREITTLPVGLDNDDGANLQHYGREYRRQSDRAAA